MQSVRNGLLNYKTRKILGNNNVARQTIAYKKAWEVGILYSVDDLQKHEMIKDFIKLLEKDVKKIEVLTYLGKDKENLEFRYNFFTISDFSFWGDPTADSIVKFAEKKFDFLLYLDLESNIYMENILARSQASCRIGGYYSDKQDFFELMVNVKENDQIRHLIDQMYHYIKIIKCPQI
ncbi:MAG: hypothetical protein M3512_01195 [Bacteroidota bacterium]|nr:hypothetical protein [Bacteroidota bacterium]